MLLWVGFLINLVLSKKLVSISILQAKQLAELMLDMCVNLIKALVKNNYIIQIQLSKKSKHHKMFAIIFKLFW